MTLSAPLLRTITVKIQLFGSWLAGFGVFGIFALTMADALVPLLPIPDLALIAISVQNPKLWLFYALVAALGSTTGSMIFYGFVRLASRRFVKSLSAARFKKIERLLGRYDILILIGAAVLPPPFPFKPFVICAGLISFQWWRLFVGLLIGRFIRYGVLACLGVYYGATALKVIQNNAGWFFLGVGAVAAGIVAFNLLNGKRERKAVAAAVQPHDAQALQ
jgi:membrane protein YqaA with SNARE-associated domain